MNRNIFLLLFLLCNISVFCQVETEENLDQYFDDNNYSKVRGIVKVNPFALITGDLTIEYEQKIAEFFSIEAGVGVLMPYYIKELMEIWVSDENLPQNVKSGFSWRVNTRFFFNKDAPHGFNMGPMYRERHYFSGSGNKTVFRDITLNYGFHYMPWKKITLDYYIGIGARLKQMNENPNNYNSSYRYNSVNVAMPIGVKIGYILY